MRAERELMRGAGPVAVLKLLGEGPMYGYQLGEALARRSAGVLDMGQSTLYPMLYNLEAKGLVEAFWQDGPSDEGGRERKYYRLTEKGKTRLATDMAQWEHLAKAMMRLGVIASPTPAVAGANAGGGQ